MRYQVRVVGDAELPSEVDYAFACVAEYTYLFVKRSALDATPGACAVLTRSFNTWEQAHSVELKQLAGAL